jgi:hypothetical protein
VPQALRSAGPGRRAATGARPTVESVTTREDAAACGPRCGPWCSASS